MCEWPTKTVADWDSFLAWASAETAGVVRACLYRGQSCESWRLEPSLLRYVGSAATPLTLEDVLALENHAKNHFVIPATVYLEGKAIPDLRKALDWYGLMQAYQAPTRLLDWTRSPYVAGYFAVAEKWDTDGAIWRFNAHEFKMANVAKGRLATPPPRDSEECIRMFTTPPADNQMFTMIQYPAFDRTVAQQGHYAVCTNPLVLHDEAIAEPFDAQQLSEHCIKVVIPKEAKSEFLGRFEAMNITAASLFPGMDGAGRFVREQVTLATGQNPG